MSSPPAVPSLRQPILDVMDIRYSSLLALLLLPPATAQTRYLGVISGGPNRTEHGMAYDTARNRVILFGGRQSNSPIATTWAFDGAFWNQLSTTGTPSARTRPAMVYDRARDRVVLFGGFDASNQMLNDTWTFDGTRWQQQSVPGPSVRAGAAMAYDRDRQVVVLFGGWVPSGNDNDETWEWNGTSWTQRFPAQRPVARGAHRMAYDAFQQQTVLFGGWRTPSNGTLGDTWTWDGTNWSQISGTGPSSRCDPGMAFDNDRVRITLYGGLLRFNGSSPVVTGDTWELDAAGWRQVTPPNSPSNRAYAQMVFDPVNPGLVLHGGNDAFQVFSNTYSLESFNPARTDPFGTGCAGSAGIPVLEGVEHRLPWLGGTFDLRIANVSQNSSVGFLLWSLSNTTWNGQMLPVDLTSLGLAGCQAWVSPDVTVLVLLNNGSGTVQGFLPNSPALVGSIFYAQGLVIDPGVTRAIPGAVTNAVEMRIGSL